MPKNLNSFRPISCTIQNILHNHPNIKKITMKYSDSEKIFVVEVDNGKSGGLIEKRRVHTDFYTPYGLT